MLAETTLDTLNFPLIMAKTQLPPWKQSHTKKQRKRKQQPAHSMENICHYYYGTIIMLHLVCIFFSTFNNMT